ncbi:M14 metallopeptidase family protein [Acanthopleuribacter pedis]|uniref:M14 metallopeptidase family protein n=1 Tax=Acanthopleuribacter pedis TaxID=442870 RepID=UPI001A9E0850|nr:M14 metallopeptidase family protein [Acanthopleuribacter pedis]
MIFWCSVGGLFADDDPLLRYLPDGTTYDTAITRPEAVLGFPVGEYHVRHDQLLNYIKRLAKESPRATWQSLGRTHGLRELGHLVITHPDNHAKLDALRREHLNHALTGETARSRDDMPVVVWLAYSIHGNEASGSNAALVAAYHLTAAQNQDDFLRRTIVLLDPCLNPDGLDRFATWVNSHRGRVPVPDAFSREHREAWPRGRTNHYWFDLNRDWLLLQHPESQARITQFQKWRPNLLADFHEMGTHSTYFFQPGVPSRQNPLIPTQTLELTREIAGFHARALDARGERYFTEEGFDDFFFGKGSTYPDAQGSIGVLFEQASARGHVQHRFDGQITFAEAVHNQVTTTLSTLEAAHTLRRELLTYQNQSRKDALATAAKSRIKAYVVGDDGDPVRFHFLLKNLLAHRIEVHALAEPFTSGDQTIERGIVIPTRQAQFPLITSLFEKRTRFEDNIFYDVSAWNFAMAHNLPFAALNEVSFRPRLLGERVTKAAFPQARLPQKAATYAYVIDWSGYFAPKAAYRLMDEGLTLFGAAKPFRAVTQSGEIDVAPGAVLVPVGGQPVGVAEVDRMVREAARESGVVVYAVETGLTPQGIDLGSRNFFHLEKPRVVLAVEGGIVANRAGELWFTLDHDYRFETSLVALKDLDLVDWSEKTHLVVPDGSLEGLDSKALQPIRAWLDKGGCLVAVGRSVRWLNQTKWISADLADMSAGLSAGLGKKGKEEAARPRWQDREKIRARKRLSGAIFAAEMDLSHPLAFGYRRPEIPLLRTHTVSLTAADHVLTAPVRYEAGGLLSGYADPEMVEALNDKVAVQVFLGGKVIVIQDQPGFRGFWRGTNRFLLNSLFFNHML